ncbi:MAG: cell division protein FtsZ [Muribaculaceae bacterium]|nr:cell division protein FtsZ [Muribaculaceae bacterium]MBR1727199.1 cell division protein FtsZ [Muribaculaceae bacterium]
MRPNIYDSVDQNPGFNEEKKNPTIIKVVGVGGGGNNAINHMWAQNVEGVSFVVINTDRQALNMSPVPNRVLIGPKTTNGLGAGNVPERAKAAAEESEAEIAALFDDETKMVFITAGMGGGTGTGAAPVVARIAHEKGVLTIGIVTIPFLFEGQKKILKALAGADEMSKYVDALLIINNQRLIDIYPDLDFNNAFGKADDTLSTAARSISELITAEGQVNVDFMDVNTTLRDGGVAIISSGYGEGEHRVTKAIEDALESPLLKNRDVYGSRKILINVYYNPDSKNPFKTQELSEVEEFMANFSQEVDVITGYAHDRTLEDKIKITVLAAGFNVSLDKEAPAPVVRHKRAEVAASEVPAAPADADKRLQEEYGAAAIAEMQTRKDEAQFILLTPEDIDNDELVDLLERTPAYKRKPDDKTAIREKRQAAATQAAKAAEQAAKPAAKKPGTTATINFGSD